MVLAYGHMAESLCVSLCPPLSLCFVLSFPVLCCLHNSEACKRPEWCCQSPTLFYLGHYSAWEYIWGRRLGERGAQFHMRGLPPHQAMFKEEQQVAAGRGNLRLSGCQSGIAAESRLFIWPSSHLHSSPQRRKEAGGETSGGAFCSALLPALMWGWETWVRRGERGNCTWY